MHGPLSALVDPADLRALSRRSDRIGLARLAAHAALILACAALVVWLRDAGRVWWSLPAMVPLGIALVALFTPLHETTHRTPFRSLWLNRAVGWVAGLVLVLPPEGFRLFHLAHHRHTQDPLRDPELIGAAPVTRAGYLWRLTGLPYWRSQIALVLRVASGRADAPWVPQSSRAHLVAEARTFLAIYLGVAAVALATRSAWPVWLYLVPVRLGHAPTRPPRGGRAAGSAPAHAAIRAAHRPPTAR